MRRIAALRVAAWRVLVGAGKHQVTVIERLLRSAFPRNEAFKVPHEPIARFPPPAAQPRPDGS